MNNEEIQKLSLPIGHRYDMWYEDLNAKIVVTDHGDGAYTTEWLGGTTAGITRRLLWDANNLFVKRDGDLIYFPGLTVRIVGEDYNHETYFVERVEE